eukprot:s635_g13.t1
MASRGIKSLNQVGRQQIRAGNAASQTAHQCSPISASAFLPSAAVSARAAFNADAANPGPRPAAKQINSSLKDLGGSLATPEGPAIDLRGDKKQRSPVPLKFENERDFSVLQASHHARTAKEACLSL